jgi:hypothetical protein
MLQPKRRKDDEKPDPIIDLYNLIADLLGHTAAARIISIIAYGEEE